jgi:hypothetical protein
MLIVHPAHEKNSLDFQLPIDDSIKQTVDNYIEGAVDGQGARFEMGWLQQLLNHIDLALGLMLSVVLGSVVGLAMSHPLGHLIMGSALGVMFLLTYVASYSFGAIWMMGAQQGLLVVSVFVWCIILSSWLSPSPDMASAVHWF